MINLANQKKKLINNLREFTRRHQIENKMANLTKWTKLTDWTKVRTKFINYKIGLSWIKRLDYQNKSNDLDWQNWLKDKIDQIQLIYAKKARMKWPELTVKIITILILKKNQNCLISSRSEKTGVEIKTWKLNGRQILFLYNK